jgi:hypothetical protein
MDVLAREYWNFETLRTAAIKFPELVADTPVRTHAILTKYTALRSYHMASTKVVPANSISYENAGIYTTMLQDAYLDYKNLLRDVDLLEENVDKGLVKITAATYVPGHEGTAGDSVTKPESTASEIKTIDSVEPDNSSADGVQNTPPSSTTSQIGDLTKVESRKGRKIPESYNLTATFPATILDLEDVKNAIRINMCRIVMEASGVIDYRFDATIRQQQTVFRSMTLLRVLM